MGEDEKCPVPAVVREAIVAIDGLVGDLPASSSIPILAEQNAYIRQYATGTLLRIGDASLLITAWHAIVDAAAVGTRLLVGGLPNSSVYIPSPDNIRGSGSKIGDDDLAVWRLHVDDVPQFASKRFLSLNDLWFVEDDPGAGTFFLYGFPEKLSDPAGPNHPRGLITPARMYMPRHTGDVSALKNYNAARHLLFSGKEPLSFDGRENPVEIPWYRYHGISGAGIWRVIPGSRPLLAVIETCVHPGGIIQGTTAYRLIYWIGTTNPDLIPLIESEVARLMDRQQ